MFTIIRFNTSYFLIAILLLLLEIYIGIYVHDDWIRPFGGDFLAVIILYCLLKCFINLPVLLASGWVLAFAYMVEASQYVHLVTLLGLQHSKLATLLLGTTFSFTDLVVYTLGVLLVVVVENLKSSLKAF